jgi:5-methyltetrahydrofolate--homocysteine methyltransferase
MEHLRAAGFSPGEVYLDPLVFPVSVDPSNGLYLVRAIEALRRSLGTEVHFAPGLSNVSFGMPNRKLLNQVFAWICRQAGMDGAIANPLHINAGVLDALDPTDPQFRLARDFLLSEDAYGMEYIAASRDGRI